MSMSLDAAQTETVAFANLCGLGHIVLQDRMVDEGTDAAAATVLLDSALAQWWFVTYAGLLGGDAWFWQAFEASMAQWRAATAASNSSPARNFDAYLRDDWRTLAHRAAPLKTCCAAVCRLARQEAHMPLLDELLDHLHVALVLLDHAHDWEQDSAAGRYNAFVHYAAPAEYATEQATVDAQTARRAVYEELWWGGQAAPYFALAQAHVAHAQVYAAHLDCPPLSARLEAATRELTAYQAAMTTTARAWLQAATAAVFGAVPS
jgi:hypothetical protein